MAECEELNSARDDQESYGVGSLPHCTPSPTHEPNCSGTFSLEKPYVGMLFDSMEEAQEFYTKYSNQEGFWPRIRSSDKSKVSPYEIIGRLFVCAREGKYFRKSHVEDDEMAVDETRAKNMKQSRTSSTVKSGCQACMRIKYDKYNLKWKVTIFNDSHNHKLVTPCKRMKMRSNKHMSKSVKDLTEAFHNENLAVGKLPGLFGGAQSGFNSRDCYNHLRNVRHKELEVGDAQGVLNYFRMKQADNPMFYYAIQCDENGRAVNFFWVDPRSRMAYRHFGDVIAFDTTYRTNKYNMPFAPFTGVNHHFQSIQFGCALLQDETEETFLWLFETWLQAMGGIPPTSIITDQDIAMKGAIAKNFPNSRHSLCLWHIKKKFVEKLSQVYYKRSAFKKEIKKCIHYTYNKESFEEQWSTLMKKYELQDNEWLKHLYEIRELWVPAYIRNTFFAGMHTTGRSEGINSFFDGFVTSTTNLREFVGKYEQALKKIVENETNEDFESEHKIRSMNKNHEFLLDHGAKVYTRNIFKKFKMEMDKVNVFRVREIDCGQDFSSFSVENKVGEYREQFIVQLNMQTYVGTCGCKYFEFIGLMCKHILKVLVREDVDMIPEHFILARWRKEANKCRIMDSTPTLTNCNSEHAEALRLNHLCRELTKIAFLSAQSQEAYVLVMEDMKELSNKVQEVLKLSSASSDSTTIPSDIEANNSNNLSQLKLLDPNISQTKGRKKDIKGKQTVENSGRIRSGLELHLGKRKRKCHLCNKLTRHDSRNCPQKTKGDTVVDVDDEDISISEDDEP